MVKNNAIFDDKSYWQRQYEALSSSSDVIQTSESLLPSNFATYLHSKGWIKGSIIELGCGSGRDSTYFARQGARVTAVDQCENITAWLSQIPAVQGVCADFTRMAEVELEHNGWPVPDLIYSRFTMHSIDAAGQDRVLRWAFDQLAPAGMFCIEARTTQDPLCGVGTPCGENVWFHNQHHRRFIDASSFRQELVALGFSIVEYEENTGFAPYGEEDPVVLRGILRKPTG